MYKHESAGDTCWTMGYFTFVEWGNEVDNSSSYKFKGWNMFLMCSNKAAKIASNTLQQIKD